MVAVTASIRFCFLLIKLFFNNSIGAERVTVISVRSVNLPNIQPKEAVRNSNLIKQNTNIEKNNKKEEEEEENVMTFALAFDIHAQIFYIYSKQSKFKLSSYFILTNYLQQFRQLNYLQNCNTSVYHIQFVKNRNNAQTIANTHANDIDDTH